MKPITQLQADCLRVIAALEEPPESSIQTELVDRYDFDGNRGRLRFALLSLIDGDYVERHEQEEETYGYSLTESGQRYVAEEFSC